MPTMCGARRDELMLARFERKRVWQQQMADILGQEQASLALGFTAKPVFIMRWDET